MKVRQLFLLLYCGCAAAQNDLDTLFEKTADWFREFMPKNAPTLATFPPFSPPPTPPPLMPRWSFSPVPMQFQTLPTPPPIPFAPIQPQPRSQFQFDAQSLFNATTPPPMNISVDPEALMTVPEIVSHWGYPIEEYNVVTKDGYILTLHRIPHGRSSRHPKKLRPVVFLQHGLLCTSSIWLLNLPRQSAGFVFADAGFDVWLGNMRGNSYSKAHVSLDATDAAFWRFSWQDMARYDLDAMIDGVLNVTGQQQLYFVGHSQGTLTMFAKLATDADFAPKIRKFFALAPVARLVGIKGTFQSLGQAYHQLNLFYSIIGDNEFLPNNLFTRLFTDVLCDRRMKNPLCEDFIYQASGPDSNQFNKTRIGIYLAHNPAGTSWKNIMHFAQMVRSGRMSPFDLGAESNLAVYGSRTPPEYDLHPVSVPLYLFYSDSDWLATSENVERFILQQVEAKHVRLSKKLKDFNHNDFLWGLRAKAEIYDQIVDVISLDHRRLSIKEGMRRYLQAKSSLPSSGDSFMQTLLS